MQGKMGSNRGLTLAGILLGGLASLVGATLVGAIALAVPGKDRAALEAPPTKAPSPPDGKELFAREWIPGDPRSHRGDGLGPVFNDSSCVACHNQGGAGGGGPASKNVHILTTAGLQVQQQVQQPSATRVPGGVPGAPTQSFVLHHFGTDAEFAAWREKMAAQAAAAMGPFSGPVSGGFISGATTVPAIGPAGPVPGSGGGPGPGGFGGAGGSGGVSGFLISLNSISQRNATALFGAGKIDSIPERVLEAAAAKKHAEFPKVVGRVARDDKGRIGRFGWKAQKASLDDFVLTACAVELGLQVPGHDQPPLPHKPDYKAPGLDLTKAECDALVKYIGDLPAPAEQTAEHPKHADFISSGKTLFATVGCATCHTPKLGDVEGIYTDLLLHDMGPGLTDAGSSYGIFQPNPQPSTPAQPKPEEIVKASGRPMPAVVATPQEWRTPPLWGARDSGPYLHDGRATTLEQAVAFHGGQAEDSTKKFNALSLQHRQKLLAFLKSLVAPEQLAAR